MDIPSPIAPQLGFGLGLRPRHHADVLEGRASVSWFEVVTENFLGDGGRSLSTLERVRRDYPVAFHGVSLSLGSTDPMDSAFLRALKARLDRFEPFIVSDHCCWTGVGGENLHNLMPLPYTRQAARHVASRILRAQDALKRRILIENVSSYLVFAHDEMSEWEFLSEVLAAADCGLLLDVNNVYVSAVNHGFAPAAYLDGLPTGRIGQIHLAGHSVRRTAAGRVYLIDTHDHPVCPEVWDLYGEALRRFGPVNTMVEWDAGIPGLEVLQAELDKARRIAREVAAVPPRRIDVERSAPSPKPPRAAAAHARGDRL